MANTASMRTPPRIDKKHLPLRVKYAEKFFLRGKLYQLAAILNKGFSRCLEPCCKRGKRIPGVGLIFANEKGSPHSLIVVRKN
jgi:hypothetical protein